MAQIIYSGKTAYLHLRGFLYLKHSKGAGNITYWKCRKLHECGARATTTLEGQTVKLLRAVKDDDHTHAPNVEEVTALRIVRGMKRRASEHPETPPVQVLRCLQEVPSAVLSQLPDRENLRKAITRVRLRELPATPRDIDDLGIIPERFRRIIKREQFLLYDSLEDDDADEACGRILVFATTDNLRTLGKARTWYVDGTFQVVPSIFFQLFVIMGSVVQRVNDVEQIVALPLVYAALENKETQTYRKVLEVTVHSLEEIGAQTNPQVIMSDFELAIINAARATVGEVSGCLFHLCQSVFRRVQSEGLQSAYNDVDDRSIKRATQMMCALAFVPVRDVPETFDMFVDQIPAAFGGVARYFEVGDINISYASLCTSVIVDQKYASVYRLHTFVESARKEEGEQYRFVTHHKCGTSIPLCWKVYREQTMLVKDGTTGSKFS